MQCKQGELLHYFLLGMVAKQRAGSETKPNKELEVKRSVMIHHGLTPTFISITGEHAFTIVHSVFSVMAGLIVEMLFMLFIKLRNGL